VHLQVGQALRSVTDATAVIVIRPPSADVELTCGGLAMVDAKSDAPEQPASPDHGSGTLLGKRYEDAAGTLELLCTKGGPSSLALDGVPMAIRSAKPLPASD
jgi:hypothetical protein